MPGLPVTPRRELRARSVPWDWTDVAIFFPSAFVITPLGAGVFEALANLVDSGLSREVRTAFHSLAGATGIYVSWLLVVLLLVRWRRHGSLRDLGWRWPRLRWLALALPLAVVTLFVALYLAELSMWLFPTLHSGQCAEVRKQFGHVVPIAIVLVSVVDPIAEETIFRGFIYGWLRSRLGLTLAVLLSAAIFSAMHFDPLLFIPLLAVGSLLALTYELSGSLLASAAVHGLFNAYNVISILNAPSC